MINFRAFCGVVKSFTKLTQPKRVLDNLIFVFPLEILVIGRVVLVQVFEIICQSLNGAKVCHVDEGTGNYFLGAVT